MSNGPFGPPAQPQNVMSPWTPTGQTVVMQPPSGGSGNIIGLTPGPTFIGPDSSGHYTVPSSAITQLLQAGWSIVVSSGTTHVP